MKKVPRNNETALGRLVIVHDCLVEEVLPRLIEDMPKPRSDKQRASLRATTNFVSGVIAGTESWLKDRGLK